MAPKQIPPNIASTPASKLSGGKVNEAGSSSMVQIGRTPSARDSQERPRGHLPAARENNAAVHQNMRSTRRRPSFTERDDPAGSESTVLAPMRPVGPGQAAGQVQALAVPLADEQPSHVLRPPLGRVDGYRTMSARNPLRAALFILSGVGVVGLAIPLMWSLPTSSKPPQDANEPSPTESNPLKIAMLTLGALFSTLGLGSLALGKSGRPPVDNPHNPEAGRRIAATLRNAIAAQTPPGTLDRLLSGLGGQRKPPGLDKALLHAYEALGLDEHFSRLCAPDAESALGGARQLASLRMLNDALGCATPARIETKLIRRLVRDAGRSDPAWNRALEKRIFRRIADPLDLPAQRPDARSSPEAVNRWLESRPQGSTELARQEGSSQQNALVLLRHHLQQDARLTPQQIDAGLQALEAALRATV